MTVSKDWRVSQQIKVLEQALAFSQDIERQLRERIERLETKLKLHSAHYSEGAHGDRIPCEQTRYWNPIERRFETGP